MSSQVNIRIPSAFAKKKKKSKEDNNNKKKNNNKWANKRSNLMVFDSSEVSSKMEESKSKIDSNNVPYAWKSKHAQELDMVETFTRKQKFKREPIRKFPDKARKAKKHGKIPILSDSNSLPTLTGSLSSDTLLSRNQSTPYLNSRPKIIASSPLGTIMPGKNLDELNSDSAANQQSLSSLKIGEKVDDPVLPWGEVVPNFLRLSFSDCYVISSNKNVV